VLLAELSVGWWAESLALSWVEQLAGVMVGKMVVMWVEMKAVTKVA
jgi:hypothetical protein